MFFLLSFRFSAPPYTLNFKLFLKKLIKTQLNNKTNKTTSS